jgi:hypothetical protein
MQVTWTRDHHPIVNRECRPRHDPTMLIQTTERTNHSRNNPRQFAVPVVAPNQPLLLMRPELSDLPDAPSETLS